MARLGPEISAAVRLAAMLGLVGALGPFFLILLKVQIYNLVLPTGSMGTAAGLVAGFAVAAVTVVALGYQRDLALLVIGNRIARRLAVPAILAAASRPGSDPAQGAAQALRDVEEVKRGVTGTLCGLALDAALVPTLLLLLGVFHWAFAVFGAVCALFSLVIGWAMERSTRRALVDANNAAMRGSALVADAVRCAEAVESMGMLRPLVRNWGGTLARGAARLRSAQGAARAASAASATLYGMATSGTLVVGALVAMNGSDPGYGIMAGLLLTARLLEPFSHVSGSLEDIADARAAWRRLDALLRDADAQPRREQRAYPCPEGKLAIEHVSLMMPGAARPLLRDVSFTLSPGEVLALTGAPGAGKTTLLRVILGLQAPTAGHVFLDGHATSHWARDELAKHIGYLPQDPALPGGTVAEAIARLQSPPDMAEVLRVARLAGAERMIAGLPQGFATPVAGPVRLSMGQRQRIALARALFGAPKILLLDEPAAYLDADGEAAVVQLIASLAAVGVGILLTSHREALLRAATRKVVLQLPAAPAPRLPAAGVAAPALKLAAKVPA